MAAESYGAWGCEAQNTFSHLAICLKSQALSSLYSGTLVRANARALLSRIIPDILGDDFPSLPPKTYSLTF